MTQGFTVTEPVIPLQQELLDEWNRLCMVYNVLASPSDLSRRPIAMDLDTRRENEIRKAELDRLRVVTAAIEDEIVQLERRKQMDREQAA